MNIYKILPTECPHCNVRLPIWTSTGKSYRTESGETAYDYSCSKCNEIIKAISYVASQVDEDAKTIQIPPSEQARIKEEIEKSELTEKVAQPVLEVPKPAARPVAQNPVLANPAIQNPASNNMPAGQASAVQNGFTFRKETGMNMQGGMGVQQGYMQNPNSAYNMPGPQNSSYMQPGMPDQQIPQNQPYMNQEFEEQYYPEQNGNSKGTAITIFFIIMAIFSISAAVVLYLLL